MIQIEYSDDEICREAHRLANTFLDHLHVQSWGTALVLDDDGYRRVERELGRIQGVHRRLSQVTESDSAMTDRRET